MHKISHNYVEPRVGINAKQNGRVLSDFQLIDRRLGQQFAKDPHLLHHRFADFHGSDALHRLGDKFQIALVGDAEFDLVPDVREDRPRVVVNGRT